MDQIEEILSGVADHRQRTGCPFVTLSYAQSLDGCIVAQPGQPLALSGAQSLILTHKLRAAHDAILVGIGTVLADNPRLDVRLAPGPDPQPVVVDSRLRFPLNANLLQQPPYPGLPPVSRLAKTISERWKRLGRGCCACRPTPTEGST